MYNVQFSNAAHSSVKQNRNKNVCMYVYPLICGQGDLWATKEDVRVQSYVCNFLPKPQKITNHTQTYTTKNMHIYI